ncbi:membrane bound O-acyl transferase family-domain-containing protein [Amylostereum chailletii]|nr:membrane bound O-acyl transferase family-domain-containing protein [Amylostereum chailletii]
MVLPDILLVVLIATQPPALVRFVGFAILVFASVTASAYTTGDPTIDYFIGFLLSNQILAAICFLWIEKPLDELRYERDSKPPREMSISRRVYWAFCLDHSVRAVGWTHQVKNVPPRPRTRPGAFVGRCLLRAILNYLMADAANTYIRAVEGFLPQSYALHSSIITAWVIATYTMTNVQYFVLAVLCVALHLSHPEDWPDAYGRAVDAFTLRNFWGKVWHQNLRRVVVPIGKRIAQSFGLKQGTLLSSHIQLYTAFILSGLINSFGDAMVGWEFTGTSMPFFLIQAVAITVEDVVIALGRKLGVEPSRLTKALGYAWVFAWGSYTFSLWRDTSVEVGWDWSAEWRLSPSRWLLQMFKGIEEAGTFSQPFHAHSVTDIPYHGEIRHVIDMNARGLLLVRDGSCT